MAECRAAFDRLMGTKNHAKNKLRSLLIEAVMYLPDDKPPSVDDLQGYYKDWIRDKPLSHYIWRRPEHYKKQRPSSGDT